MFSSYAAMGNAPESIIDPNGMSLMAAGGSNEIKEFQGSDGAAHKPYKDPNENLGAGGANNSNSGYNADVVTYYGDEAREVYSSMVGASNNQGDGDAVTNFDSKKNNKKGDNPGPFNEAEELGDVPETKAWDLNDDGKLSPDELRAWRENGNGRSIEVDASKLNIGYVDFSKLKEGDRYTFFLYSGFLLRGNGYHEGRIIGAVGSTYLGSGEFKLDPNLNDYKTGAENGTPWFGKGSTFWRNVGTKVGLWLDGGKNGGTDFNIFFRGNVKARPFPIPSEIERINESNKTPGDW